MNEMYLKMILALPDEFFDGWEWNAGDRAILLDDHYKREVLVINTHYQIISSRVAKLLFPGSLEGCKTEEHITRLRPIPRQEQLQKMLESKMLTTGGNRWHVFCTFDKFVRSEYERRSFWKTGKLITDSFEMLWLACVMKEKYGKEWDGEKWI